MKFLVIILILAPAIVLAQDGEGIPADAAAGPPCMCKGSGKDYYYCGQDLNAQFGNTNCKENYVYVCQGNDKEELPASPKVPCKHICAAGPAGSGAAGCKKP